MSVLAGSISPRPSAAQTTSQPTECEQALDSLTGGARRAIADDPKLTAIAISGGGSKGAFAVGAVCYLVTRGIAFDIVAGTSTGALIAPLVVAGRLEPLVRGYTEATSDSILKARSARQLLKKENDAFYDTTPLERQIAKWLPDSVLATVLESSTTLLIATTMLQSGEVAYWRAGRGPELVTFATPAPGGFEREFAAIHDTIFEVETPEELRRVVLASSNQPVFMPPIEVREPPPIRQFVDGGVRENAPLQIAVRSGATELYAVWLGPDRHKYVDEEFLIPDVSGTAAAFSTAEPPKSCYKEAKKLPVAERLKRIALRAITMFVREVAENDVEGVRLYAQETAYRDSLKLRLVREAGLNPRDVERLFHPRPGAATAFGGPSVRLIVIQPEEELPSDGLHFDRACMRWMMDYGFERAREAVEGD